MRQEKIDVICKNINREGLYRYDPRDVSDFAAFFKNRHVRNIVSIVLQLGEIVNPILVRKLIGAKKRLYPTTFTFLAESQLLMDNKLDIEDDVQLMRRCLQEYYEGNGYWKYKENKAFFPLPSNKKPSMPLYMLCRCNNLLIRIGKKYDLPEMVSISNDSAQYMLRMHIISRCNELESISYYYNSDECTINVNTEILDWLTLLTVSINTEIYIEHVLSILRMVLSEQNADGSWDYLSKNTMRKYRLNPSIDCHHTATVLYNLIHVYELGSFITQELREELLISIKKGMGFFYKNFFDENGNGRTLVGRNRKASTMQYAEALIAMGEYMRVIGEDSIYSDIQGIYNKIVFKISDLVEADGSAPGDIKISPININNINWGNGAALFALCYFQKHLRAY